MKKPLTHDKALQAAMLEYGRFIRAGEGSTRAVERAIEVYNYVTAPANKEAQRVGTDCEPSDGSW